MLTKADETYIRDVRKLVKKVERVSPPPLQHLQGPSTDFITPDPAIAIRQRLRRERIIDRFIAAGIYLGGIAAGLSASFVVTLYVINLINP